MTNSLSLNVPIVVRRCPTPGRGFCLKEYATAVSGVEIEAILETAKKTSDGDDHNATPTTATPKTAR